MKSSVADIASLGILGCALLLTSVIVKREFLDPEPRSPTRKVPRRADVQLVGRVIGKSDAAVSVVVFADFQCPYCARAQALIQATLRRNEGRVNVIYRHLPLQTIHPRAWEAAIASECAGEQGVFHEYHDLLYARQDSIGRIPWQEFAARAGAAAPESFERCLESEQPNDAVERDVVLARQLGIDRTPAFIVGDQMYAGVPPSAWIERRIAAELRRAAKQ